MELYEKIEKLCAATKAASPSIAQASTKQKNEALENVVFDLHNKYGRGILKTAKELKARRKLSENIRNDKDKTKP